MSEQGPPARPVVFRKPSYGSFGVTVIEPRQDVRRRNYRRRRSYSQACDCCWLPGWGRPLGKLMNNCETDISFRGSCSYGLFPWIALPCFAFGQKIWHPIFFSPTANFKIFPSCSQSLAELLRL